MLSINIDSARLNLKLKEFAKTAGKELSVAVKEEAALVAQSLVKLTPPGKASEGKTRVAIDLGRVYLASKWFLDVFQFRRQKLGDKVKEAVRRKDAGTLETIFERSGKLRRIEIEPFNASRHKQLRKNGRVPQNWHPGSFPLSNESQTKRYERTKQKNVGLAKSGWATALRALGKSVAGWLDKGDTGAVKDDLKHPTKPSITLINKVSYFASLDQRKKIVATALRGRLSALQKKIEVTLRLAARRV